MMNVKVVLLLVASFSLPTACGDDESNTLPLDTTPISMITPYVNEADMGPVREAFSTTATAPWHFVHTGIDFFPAGGADLKPFQAVSSGTVTEVRLWQNGTNWQVNITIKHNDAYSVGYSFEPMTGDQVAGDTQLENILISVRQRVSQGDLIGYLHAPNGNSHVDLGLIKFNKRICPEPYFTQAARDSILTLIRQQWGPDALMCYE